MGDDIFGDDICAAASPAAAGAGVLVE